MRNDDVEALPYTRGDGERAALVLHGFTGTPFEVRGLADALADRGFAVSVPRLAGHGDLEALERSSWREWYASAEQAWSDLHDGGRRRAVVVGFSMGGLLALRLAALRAHEVVAVAALSVPLQLRRWQRGAIAVLAALRRRPGLGHLVGVLPKAGPDVRVRREFERSPSLRGLPYPALAQLVELQAEVDALLPHVVAPLLVMHGRLDHTARVADSARLSQRVGSVRVRRELLPDSFHIIGLDVDRDAAAAALVGFAVAELGDPRQGPPP